MTNGTDHPDRSSSVRRSTSPSHHFARSASSTAPLPTLLPPLEPSTRPPGSHLPPPFPSHSQPAGQRQTAPPVPPVLPVRPSYDALLPLPSPFAGHPSPHPTLSSSTAHFRTPIIHPAPYPGPQPPQPPRQPSRHEAHPPASASGGTVVRYVPGFYPDYDRPTVIRRPTAGQGGTITPSELGQASNAGPSRQSSVASREFPAEAFRKIRRFRPQQSSNVAGSSFSTATSTQGPLIQQVVWDLRVVQQPTQGVALGFNQMAESWHSIAPPPILRLIPRDEAGNPLALDEVSLLRPLSHVLVAVGLETMDGVAASAIRPVRREGSSGHPMQALLGCSILNPWVSTVGGTRGLYVCFDDLVVRPPGQFVLVFKVLDVAGPPNIGVSVGITPISTVVRSQPFMVRRPGEAVVPSATSASVEVFDQRED